MPGINDAIKQIDKLKPGNKLCYQSIADNHGVDCTTLSRRHQGVQTPIATKNINQLKVNLHQEEELVQYIVDLTECHLPPTREMIKNFAHGIAKVDVSETWVTRFLQRHKDVLTSRWTSPMAADRHAADSYDKYEEYFNLMRRKIAQYGIEPEQIYNMDEKGFAAGVIGKSKRVFSKASYQRKHARQSLHNGNRKWITLVVCICADGTALPPGLIFAAESKNIQSTWVSNLDKKKHSVFTTVSSSGWSNNDAGLAWLEQVFNRFTKRKAHGNWRLLILDGHGSHITMDFIKLCDKYHILLAIYPPHSTHTLQPLDVVCFSPLAGNYSKVLTKHLHQSQGLLPFKKGDFFCLFWEAWTTTFTGKLVLSSFKATGLVPLNPGVILDRFAKSKPEQGTIQSANSGEDWRDTDQTWRQVVKDPSADEAKKPRQTFHHLSNENELLKIERDSLQFALNTERSKPKKSKPLPLIQCQETRAKTQW
jgi:hypothetical protein